jgi:tellurium resistance protein TerZ
MSAAGFGVQVLHRADARASPEDLDLPKGRYGFGVSWDTVRGRSVDIDLQCVVVDKGGSIVDCAYYNNLKAAGAITHSGDEAMGKPDNIEEMVWVNMRKVQQNVSLLVFVVAAYSGGNLEDVSNGRLHVLEERQTNEIALFEMERSKASVDVVAAMFRTGPGGQDWKLKIIDVPAQAGRHFMDILPLLSQVVRSFVPGAPQRQKVAFAMEKGAVLDLPMGMGQITVGLGWDVDEGECDLDVSAVLLDTQGSDLEAVFFGRLESEEHGIEHTGDNLTGEGEGDDEQINVRLDRIGPKVEQVVFVVNIYSQNKTFQQVAEPFCRVVDTTDGSELCRYALRDAGRENGLIIAKIAREAGGRWGFHALGLPCRGRTYKDSLPKIRQTCHLKTSSLVLPETATATWATPRGPPSDPCLLGHLGSGEGKVATRVQAPTVQASDSQKCCCVQ